MINIPTGDARELPPDEAFRELIDTFHAIEFAPTEPMPLELEPLTVDQMQAEIARVFRR